MLSKSSRTSYKGGNFEKSFVGGVRYRSGCRPFRRSGAMELLGCLTMEDLK
jgi:hypothetical protein